MDFFKAKSHSFLELKKNVEHVKGDICLLGALYVNIISTWGRSDMAIYISTWGKSDCPKVNFCSPMLEAWCLMVSLLDYRPKDEEFKRSRYS